MTTAMFQAESHQRHGLRGSRVEGGWRVAGRCAVPEEAARTLNAGLRNTTRGTWNLECFKILIIIILTEHFKMGY